MPAFSTDSLVVECVDGSGAEVALKMLPGRACRGLREGKRYRILKPDSRCLLVIDDLELEEDDNYWYWSPGFFAGQVRAELLDAHDALLATYIIDVSPHEGKLGQADFQQMLDEIWEYDPRLVIGTEPAQTSIGHENSIVEPWLEYSRLRTFGNSFANALDQIARLPIRELLSARQQVPIQYIRHADRQTALSALRNPAMAAAITGSNPRTQALPLFDVPVTRETMDSAANRCIAAITRLINLRVKRLKRVLEKEIEDEPYSDTRSDLASRWPRRRAFLDSLTARLRRAQRTGPLAQVTRPEISSAGLNAVSADPAYSRAYSLGWKILRRGIEGNPDAEMLWISPTWEIYERWCFVRLCEMLHEKHNDFDWHPTDRHPSGATRALVGVRDNGSSIELLLQPQIPAVDGKERGGFISVSKAREPDIVLTFSQGDDKRWLVLDAKYRTTRSAVLDAMTSAHIYQDALRFHGNRPALSMLLIPKSGGAPLLETQQYAEENRVGVVPLTIGQILTESPVVMRSWLKSM